MKTRQVAMTVWFVAFLVLTMLMFLTVSHLAEYSTPRVRLEPLPSLETLPDYGKIVLPVDHY